MGGHFLASYPAMGYRREAVAYFISRVIPTTSFAKISFQHHAFCLCKQLTYHYRGADSKSGNKTILLYEKTFYLSVSFGGIVATCMY